MESMHTHLPLSFFTDCTLEYSFPNFHLVRSLEPKRPMEEQCATSYSKGEKRKLNGMLTVLSKPMKTGSLKWQSWDNTEVVLSAKRVPLGTTPHGTVGSLWHV